MLSGEETAKQPVVLPYVYRGRTSGPSFRKVKLDQLDGITVAKAVARYLRATIPSNVFDEAISILGIDKDHLEEIDSHDNRNPEKEILENLEKVKAIVKELEEILR